MASRFCLIDQMVFFRQLMRQIFEHIEHRGAFPGRQPLFIQKILAAEHQHPIALAYAGCFNAGQRVFMIANKLVCQLKQRLTIDRLLIGSISPLLKNLTSLRPTRPRGKFSLHRQGVSRYGSAGVIRFCMLIKLRNKFYQVQCDAFVNLATDLLDIRP
jgi:hypothetical protein